MKKFDATIHMSLKKRKMWGHKMRLIFLGLIVILLLCSVCFTFGCVTWNPEEEPGPVANPQYWWQYLLIVIGALVAVGSIVAYVLYTYFEIKAFYTTQMIYFATPEFAKAKERALKIDLSLLKSKDLKWYKKMGFITSKEVSAAKEKQKKLKLEAKQAGKSFVYALPLIDQK